MGSKWGILLEFWAYLKASRNWWIAPIVAFLILFGAVIIVSEVSSITPFLYVLF